MRLADAIKIIAAHMQPAAVAALNTSAGGSRLHVNSSLPDEVKNLLVTEEGRTRLLHAIREASDTDQNETEAVVANVSSADVLRPPTFFGKQSKRSTMHVSGCQCEPCKSQRREPQQVAMRQSDDAPLLPRAGLLAGVRR